MTTEKNTSEAAPKNKAAAKKPNVVARFFNAIGLGIKAFFVGIGNAIWAVVMFVWELIWTIVTFIYDMIIKIIQATMKYILMIWGFILATILVVAALLWLITASFANISETNIGASLAGKIEPAIEKIAEQINGKVIREIEMGENGSKEEMLKAELKRLQEMRIEDLESELEAAE